MSLKCNHPLLFIDIHYFNYYNILLLFQNNAGLHQNLKRLSSIKVQKEKVHSPRETKRLEALAKMAEEDPDDQNYGTVLSNAITINAKINMLKMKKLKERKQKKAIELLQNQLCDGSTPRPSWNTSMVFPYRYKKMDKEEIPCLGRMFKPMSFWSKGCNPKVIVSVTLLISLYVLNFLSFYLIFL